MPFLYIRFKVIIIINIQPLTRHFVTPSPQGAREKLLFPIMSFLVNKCNFLLAPWGEDARRAGEGPGAFLIHRIPHSPFLSQFIHLFHDRKGFCVRHHRGFEKSLLYATLALKHLILIACNHILRLLVCCHEFLVSIHLNKFWAVHVINTDITIHTTYNTLSVIKTQGTRLQISHLSVSV